jgi:hypothetical protein
MRRISRPLPFAALLAFSLALSGCGGDDGDPPPILSPAPTPAPAPTPSPTPASYTVTPCLNQTVVPGRTLAQLVVPDMLRLDMSQPAGFPNGRRYTDPVIDLTLAAIFLDLRVHPVTTFASIPVNPGGNDRPQSATFPFLAPPHGNPVLAPTGGANWNFRTDPTSAYIRVDRMGMPAVATALIGSSNKNNYNDDSPLVDSSGKWVPELVAQLTALTNALADDFQRLNLTLCAQRL